MALTELNQGTFRYVPKVELKKVGWDDEKGRQVLQKIDNCNSVYQDKINSAIGYAEAYHRQKVEIDNFLNKNEPTISTRI